MTPKYRVRAYWKMLPVTRIYFSSIYDENEDSHPIIYSEVADKKWWLYEYTLNPWEYELMQFTWIEDNNGLGVYEWDLLKLPGSQRHREVKLQRWEFTYWCHDPNNRWLSYSLARYSSCEIVGNKYEHTHLLDNI